VTDEIARRAVIHGRVQGVFFRAHVARAAEDHGARGWAANRPDGAVEVHAEGAPGAVTAVIEAARSGSENARVDAIDVWEVAPEGCEGFAAR
jgi:acylphosphatase